MVDLKHREGVDSLLTTANYMYMASKGEISLIPFFFSFARIKARLQCIYSGAESLIEQLHHLAPHSGTLRSMFVDQHLLLPLAAL